MISSSEARAVGRQMMKEHKGLLFGACFIHLGIALALSWVPVAFDPTNAALAFVWSILVLFVTYPLILGILHVNNMVYYKRDCSIGNMFEFFKYYQVSLKVIGVNVILTALLMLVTVPLGSILLVGPLLRLGAGGYGYGLGAVASGIFSLLGAFLVFFLLLLVISMVLSSIIMANYFIALRNRSIPFGRLLSSSFKIGWAYVWKYFVLQLTFFGWGLLASLFLLVPMTIAIAASAGGGGMGFAVTLVLLGTVLFLLAVIVLDVYITAASVAFFNVAIDEYEQEHPAYSGFTPPPHIPEAPMGGTGAFPSGEPPYGQQPQGHEQPPAGYPAPPSPGAGPYGGQTPPPFVPAEEAETGSYDVILVSAGIGRMYVTQIIREATGMGLEDAKALVENLPKAVKMGISKAEARELAKKLTDAGAQVEIR